MITGDPRVLSGKHGIIAPMPDRLADELISMGSMGMFFNSWWNLVGVVFDLMQIYSIYFDRIRKETDLGEMFLQYDLDTGAVLHLTEESAREVIKDRSGKETGYHARTFPRFRCCRLIILYHRRCIITRKRWRSINDDIFWERKPK